MENRFEKDKFNDCLMTVDGTDFRIYEQGPAFYSHKFKGSGLRYEVVLCILTGKIVWINGPFECGLWPDINIFRSALMLELEDGERVEAYDGYVGEAPKHIKCPQYFCNPEETEFMQQRICNRHESVNKRFKQFGILKQVYHHDLSDHADVFRAIAVITEIAIENGKPLFECGYRDPPYN